jgi:hypothetical protein
LQRENERDIRRSSSRDGYDRHERRDGPRDRRSRFDDDDDVNDHHHRSDRRSASRRPLSYDPMERYADFCRGMTVEARYQGHGAWQDAKVTEVNPDLTLNLVYHDGEVATGVSPKSVRKLREGMAYVCTIFKI